MEDVTGQAYLDGLEGWPLEVVRARRDEATEVETGLSYLRRMIQGTLDIVMAESRSRQEGGSPSDLAALVDQLPTILGDHVHAPGLGRLPTLMGPGELDPALEARLAEVMPAGRLAALGELDSAALAECAEGLADLERTVSSQRRAVFDVLDQLQGEIVRRYSTGEATVDNLLP